MARRLPEGTPSDRAANAALPIVFRPADARDWPEVEEIWVAAWAAAMPHLDFHARRSWFRERMAEHSEAGARTTLALNGWNCDLLGFVTVNSATGYLDQFVVTPKAQGSGVARQLLARARCLSPGVLELHVNQDNPRAIRFYEREGFVRTGAGANERSGLPVWRMEWRGAKA